MQPGKSDGDLLPLLLEICEDYFAGASTAARREVDALLRSRDITGGPGWLIDMLALTRLRLHGGTGTHNIDHAETHRPGQKSRPFGPHFHDRSHPAMWLAAGCPRPVNDPHRRPFTAPLMARVLPVDGQMSPR